MPVDMRVNVPLSHYTTMRLGGVARFFVDVATLDEIKHVCKAAKEHNLPLFVLGGGSNTIALDEGFNGIVMHNRLKGFDVLEQDELYATITVAGGENWDETVKKTVDMHLSGIEALSGIPGTVGAAPVQNIGAYGQEVGTVITHLTAYDTTTDTVVELTADDCHFGYRSSIFREEARNRYIITSVTMRLPTQAPQPPFYEAVEKYLESHNIQTVDARALREAVLAIRTDKLPDPALLPNAGSFFKNAVIERWRCDELLRTNPDMPYYAMADDQCKIPTGWLIDQLDYRGKVLHGIKVHDKNALLLINESASSYDDLAAARDEIAGQVRDRFQINIEQEPLNLTT